MSLSDQILRKAFGGPHGVLGGVPCEGGPTLNSAGEFSIYAHVGIKLTPEEYAHLILTLTRAEVDTP